jgi:hypothetical protein
MISACIRDFSGLNDGRGTNSIFPWFSSVATGKFEGQRVKSSLDGHCSHFCDLLLVLLFVTTV